MNNFYNFIINKFSFLLFGFGPNPQSPIPNPQSPKPNNKKLNLFIIKL